MKSTEQLDPQLIWFGLLGLEVAVTVPLPVSKFVLVTETGNLFRVKVAVTDLAALIVVTVQVLPETESHPIQLVKLELIAGVAVRVTAVPLS